MNGNKYTKYLLTTLTAIFAFGILATSVPVLAQTPDGQTPAKEMVCDPLKEDGVTKGLYGLCVAFCEAGDYADEADTITPEELITLESSTPSGRILANYNKKKDKANNPNDPEMPCILVAEPCPCWTADELADTADGIHNISGNQPQRVGCYANGGPVPGGGALNTFDYSYDTSSGLGIRYGEQAVVLDYSHLKACYYFLEDPSVPNVNSQLSIQAGTLTPEQHDACMAQMVAHWETRTLCSEGNHP